ncbi:MAG: hypothetical protein SFV19_03295 [Rhodospirillaceae bacterium]|nr:hypothetical protein [Rhodospirillaceae bacterium]
MTDLVTLNAAREAQQYALTALQPQGVPHGDRQASPIQVSESAVNADVRRAPNQPEPGAGKHSNDQAGQRRNGSDGGLTGPSRPQVEIRAFEEAPRAEPVAQPDIVPTTAPSPGLAAGPLNSLATSPVVSGRTQAEVEVAIAQQAIQTAAFEQASNAGARSVRLEAAAKIVRAESVAVAILSQPAQAPEVQLQKFADKVVAGLGTPSGAQEVPQKYFGKGSEAVIGQFAAQADQQQKFSDRAVEAERGKFSEAGSGETKYYDKVAQTETEFAGGESSGEQRSMYERAQEVTAGGSPEPAPGTPAHPELNVYVGPKAPAANPTVAVQVTA